MTTKKQSGYVMPLPKTVDKGGLNCQNCYYFQEGNKSLPIGKCTIVKGNIDAMATCNLWSKTGPLKFDFLSGLNALKKLQKGKIGKSDAGYTDARHTISIIPTMPHKGIRCDSCINFIEVGINTSIGLCKGVEGAINKNACCNLWTDIKGAKMDYASGKEVKLILDIEDLV